MGTSANADRTHAASVRAFVYAPSLLSGVRLVSGFSANIGDVKKGRRPKPRPFPLLRQLAQLLNCFN